MQRWIQDKVPSSQPEGREYSRWKMARAADYGSVYGHLRRVRSSTMYSERRVLWFGFGARLRAHHSSGPNIRAAPDTGA